MSDLPAGLQLAAGASRYFDWASLSPLCRGAVEGQAEYLHASAHAIDATAHMRHAVDLHQLRSAAKAFVAGQPEDQVVLGRSASELLSMFANGLGVTRGRSVVVLCEPNHPCAPLAWRGAATTRGLQVLSVPCTTNFEIDLSALEQVLTPQCLAVIATHVDHLHGVVQPIAAVAKLAQAAGAVTIVDGAQAAGRVRIDVAALQTDAYIAVGRKALMAPMGTAFAIATPSLLERTSPSVWSTRSAAVGTDGRPVLAESPVHLEGNLPDLAALSGFRRAIESFSPLVVNQVQAHVRRLLPILFDGLSSVGLRPCRPLSPDNAGIASFLLPAHANGEQVQDKLRLEGFVVAANRRELRVSLHLANDSAAIENLVEKVREIV